MGWGIQVAGFRPGVEGFNPYVTVQKHGSFLLGFAYEGSVHIGVETLIGVLWYMPDLKGPFLSPGPEAWEAALPSSAQRRDGRGGDQRVDAGPVKELRL